MAKITYLLGAGASYYACPILEKQAEFMIEIAVIELQRFENGYGFIKPSFNDKEKNEILSKDDRTKILWHIGYFGIKAKEYNTIDTYARKLELNGEEPELRILKMCVSIFFDLWENYYHQNYHLNNELSFSKIDNRYKSLFSVLLDKENNGRIKLNEDFKFLTWNYDLQLEETFKLFLGEKHLYDLDSIDKSLKFKNDNTDNDVLHLNGYTGFYQAGDDGEEILLNTSNNIEDYWKNLEEFFAANNRKKINFNNHIKYAWEHNPQDIFFSKMNNILKETEVLVIIGYSFPAFNRKIDQNIFENLDNKKIKKIIYQDPNATKELILNLFKNPNSHLEKKIEILNNEKSLKQFYLPNEFFITQEDEFFTF